MQTLCVLVLYITSKDIADSAQQVKTVSHTLGEKNLFQK